MKYVGICLIIMGVLMLLVLFLSHLTFVNPLLYTAFLMIVAGAVLYVWRLKKESKY